MEIREEGYEYNGWKLGEKVLYNGEETKIVAFDEDDKSYPILIDYPRYKNNTFYSNKTITSRLKHSSACGWAWISDKNKNLSKITQQKEDKSLTEKVEINNTTYLIDINKAIELGVLIENNPSLMPIRELHSSFYWIDLYGNIIRGVDNNDSTNIPMLYSKGNYFKSKEHAQYILDNHLLINQITNYLSRRNIEYAKPDITNKICTVYYNTKNNRWEIMIPRELSLFGCYTYYDVASDCVEILNKICPNGEVL